MIRISKHAVERARARFAYFGDKAPKDVNRILLAIAKRGKEYGESAIVGTRYFLGHTHTRKPVVLVVRDDRDGTGDQIVTTVLTAEEAHGAGPWRRKD